MYKEPVCIIPTIIIIAIVVFGIYSIFFAEYEYTSFNEFTIDGLTFNIPSDYTIKTKGNNADSSFNKFFTTYTTKSKWHTYKHTIYIEIYVYKNKTVQQVLATKSKGWDVSNAAFGNYTGYKLEKFGFEGCWFIFQKEGKTVAFYCERTAIVQNLGKIIG